MRFGSVCSGIEAASVAWGPLGWKAAWFSEIDPFASAVLAHHYPTTPNLGDMNLVLHLLRAGLIEAPDILCGGTPCQAFSVAGLRRSLDDARGNLSLIFCEIANAVDDRRGDPCIVFWENVPGVLSTKDNAFGCLLAGLAGEDDPLVPPGGKWSNAGAVYGPRRAVAWRVLDAQYFGVAQRRRRVFVVASARPGFDPAAVLFEFDGVRRDSAPRREAGEEAAAGTLRSTDGGCDLDHARAGHVRAVAGTLDASFGRLQGCSGQDANHGHSHLVPVAYGGNNQSGPIDVATARNACSSASGRLDFESETFLLQPVAFDTTQITSAANYSSPKPGDPCHPLAAGAHAPAIAFDSRQDPVSSEHLFGALGSSSPQAQAVASAMQVRRLTPTECERLQGFPDGYTAIPWRGKQAPDGPRYKALGNSWAVPNVRWIGARIQGALS